MTTEEIMTLAHEYADAASETVYEDLYVETTRRALRTAIDELVEQAKWAHHTPALLSESDAVADLAGVARPGAEPPLLGRWHHGNGVLVSGTIRIARWDCDTNPPEEFRDEVLNWVCDALNAALSKPPQPTAELMALCERICTAIKAADDKSVDEAGYMLDSNDCIGIVREHFLTAPEAPQASQPEAQIRAAFEAWLKSYSTLSVDRDRHGYEDMTVETLWHAWQAAQKAKAPEGAHAGESDANAELGLAEPDSTCRHEFSVQPSSGIKLCIHCGLSEVSGKKSAHGIGAAQQSGVIPPDCKTRPAQQDRPSTAEWTSDYVRDNLHKLKPPRQKGKP